MLRVRCQCVSLSLIILVSLVIIVSIRKSIFSHDIARALYLLHIKIL